MTTVTLLHPGTMGAAVGQQAARNGIRVLWVPDGRSAATAGRADAAGFVPAEDLPSALAASDIVLSVCPPAAAEDVSEQVAAHRFTGVYVDANAISPRRMHRIAQRQAAAGAVPVDGCLIGPPPAGTAIVRLYLAAEREQPAGGVAKLFSDTRVVARILEDRPVGAASALKMAFGGYHKAAWALSAVSHALAETHGVREELTTEAAAMAAAMLAETGYLPSVAARAWRWAPEMLEVADALAEAGLPDDLARGAAATMDRWEPDKDDMRLTVADVLRHLRAA